MATTVASFDLAFKSLYSKVPTMPESAYFPIFAGSKAATAPADLREQARELEKQAYELRDQAHATELRQQEREAAQREREERRTLAIATLTAVANDVDAPGLTRVEAARQLAEIA